MDNVEWLAEWLFDYSARFDPDLTFAFKQATQAAQDSYRHDARSLLLAMQERGFRQLAEQKQIRVGPPILSQSYIDGWNDSFTTHKKAGFARVKPLVEG